MALGKTVDQLLRETTSAELTEWRAYYQLEPWGSLMDDRRHGIATSVLANVNRDAKRTPNPYKETDFVFWHEAHRQARESVLKVDPNEQSELIKQLFRKHQG